MDFVFFIFSLLECVRRKEWNKYEKRLEHIVRNNISIRLLRIINLNFSFCSLRTIEIFIVSREIWSNGEVFVLEFMLECELNRILPKDTRLYWNDCCCCVLSNEKHLFEKLWTKKRITKLHRDETIDLIYETVCKRRTCWVLPYKMNQCENHTKHIDFSVQYIQ